VAKEANASAGDNRACSDGRDRENKCGSRERTEVRGKGQGFLQDGTSLPWK